MCKLIRIMLLLMLLWWLFGCGTVAPVSNISDDCLSTPQLVSVKLYDTAGEVRAAFQQLSGKTDPYVEGFTTYNTRTQVYTLHAKRGVIRKASGHGTLGHEVLHAVCGRWHTEDIL